MVWCGLKEAVQQPKADTLFISTAIFDLSTCVLFLLNNDIHHQVTTGRYLFNLA